MIQHCDLSLFLTQSSFSGAEEYEIRYECVGEECPNSSACGNATCGSACDYRPAIMAALTTVLFGVQEALREVRQRRANQ